MREVARRSKPYCTCTGRIDGWAFNGRTWVHPACRKPSYLPWLKGVDEAAWQALVSL